MLATFSRRAAAELNRRVQRLLQRRLAAEAAAQATPAYAGTFHSIGARLLREYASRLGLDPQFTIHDREDSGDLMNWARHAAGLSDRPDRFPTKATCLAIYSRVVNSQAPLAETLGKHFPWAAAHEEALRGLFAGYVEAKQRQSVLDYDDLLLYFAQSARRAGNRRGDREPFRSSLGRRVSGHQPAAGRDRAAPAPARARTDGGRRRRAVDLFVPRRDGAQHSRFSAELSIRRPASSRSIAIIARRSRSSPPSNAVIGLSPERCAKDLWTDRGGGAIPQLVTTGEEADQARYVATRVLENREAGATLKSQAVLFRAAHHSAALELELTRRNVPFVKFGGLKFLDAAHIKDVLALLRFAENPRDRVAGFRVAQLLPGIGPASAERIVAAAAAGDGFATLQTFAPPAKARAAFAEFVALLGRVAQARPGRSISAKSSRGGAHVSRTISTISSPRAADLDALERIATTYPSRERFLSELTLDPPDATSDEAGPPHRDEDYLILSTIHSAKGQEWKSVFVLNCVDGCIPSDLATGSSDEIEEERRLLYVAMTRARDELTLVVPQRFYVHGQPRNGDRHVLASRTRFIPPDLLKHFERVAWPPPQAEAARVAREGPAVDLAARMRAMWR